MSIPAFRPLPTNPRFKNLTNRRFGLWVALGFLGNEGAGYGQAQWWCHCDCGSEKKVAGSTLSSGKSLSCGCRRAEVTTAAKTTHGLSKHPLYGVWKAMIDRCHNPDSPAFYHYGQRGIEVCPEWRASLANFIADMGERPFPGAEIERKNNALGYCKSNCVWATRGEQMRNTRRNHILTHDGESLPLTDWATRRGIHPGTVNSRLRGGWTVADALTIPVRKSRRWHADELVATPHGI